MKKIENDTQKIYLDKNDVPKTGTRKELVLLFLRKKVPSYTDEECTILQCDKGRYRSVSELYYIVRTRFPKTSFKGFVKVIALIIQEHKNIGLVWCTQIHKVVIRYMNNPSAEYITKYSRDKFMEQVGEDGLSLKTLEKIKTTVLK
jgi:hypothetical protein